MKNIFVIASLVILLTAACARSVNPGVEKAAVKDVLDKMKQAMTSEDINLFSSVVAHDTDMVNFGTDASERWVGWDALKSSIEKQFAAFDKLQIAVRDQVIEIGAGGKTAWFSQVMDWHLKTGGKPVILDNIRATGVLEKRTGKWLLVQMHFSVGVSGQAAEY